MYRKEVLFGFVMTRLYSLNRFQYTVTQHIFAQIKPLGELYFIPNSLIVPLGEMHYVDTYKGFRVHVDSLFITYHCDIWQNIVSK